MKQPSDTQREVQEVLQEVLPKAAETLDDLLDADDDRIRLETAKTVLDRGGMPEAKQVKQSVAAREVAGEDDDLDDLLFS